MDTVNINVSVSVLFMPTLLNFRPIRNYVAGFDGPMSEPVLRMLQGTWIYHETSAVKVEFDKFTLVVAVCLSLSIMRALVFGVSV